MDKRCLHKFSSYEKYLRRLGIEIEIENCQTKMAA